MSVHAVPDSGITRYTVSCKYRSLLCIKQYCGYQHEWYSVHIADLLWKLTNSSCSVIEETLRLKVLEWCIPTSWSKMALNQFGNYAGEKKVIFWTSRLFPSQKFSETEFIFDRICGTCSTKSDTRWLARIPWNGPEWTDKNIQETPWCKFNWCQDTSAVEPILKLPRHISFWRCNRITVTFFVFWSIWQKIYFRNQTQQRTDRSHRLPQGTVRRHLRLKGQKFAQSRELLDNELLSACLLLPIFFLNALNKWLLSEHTPVHEFAIQIFHTLRSRVRSNILTFYEPYMLKADLPISQIPATRCESNPCQHIPRINNPG